MNSIKIIQNGNFSIHLPLIRFVQDIHFYHGHNGTISKRRVIGYNQILTNENFTED